jgi:hypothetical protein
MQTGSDNREKTTRFSAKTQCGGAGKCSHNNSKTGQEFAWQAFMESALCIITVA